MYQYSDREKRLLEHFDCIHFIESESVGALPVYRLMCEVAFLRGEESKEAESLRRCMRAWGKMKVHRLTPEWDAMIEFSGEKKPAVAYLLEESLKKGNTIKIPSLGIEIKPENVKVSLVSDETSEK